MAAGAFIGSLAEEALFGERSALAAGRKLEILVSQSGQGLRQYFVFASIGQKAVVPHFSKMRRQDMQAEPPEKLRTIQCHFLFPCAISIILVGKADGILSDVQDAVVGNGNAVGVPGQVLHHLLGPGERFFGVGHPCLRIERFFPAVIRAAFVGEASWQGQQALFQCETELMHEEGPEHLFHSRYRVKETGIAPFWELPLAIFTQASTGHDAMDMGVQRQVLPPSVKYHCGGGACPQPLWAAAKAVQGMPSGFEQQAIHETGVVHAQAIKLMRQGEYHMEIGNRQELLLLLYGPHLFVQALASGTMAVAAAIIADAQVAALITSVNMAAQSGGTAGGDSL